MHGPACVFWASLRPFSRQVLWASRSTAERLAAGRAVLERAVCFTPDGAVDRTASNYALDHPDELFELGGAPPWIVQLLQSPQVVATLVAVVAIFLALWHVAAG